MTGSLATAIAIVAVAIAGLLLLTGRLAWRRGVTLVVGLFILFGAPTIAAGLLGAIQGQSDAVAAPPAEPAPLVVATKPPPGYDPYAGASIIRQAPPPTVPSPTGR